MFVEWAFKSPCWMDYVLLIFMEAFPRLKSSQTNMKILFVPCEFHISLLLSSSDSSNYIWNILEACGTS